MRNRSLAGGGFQAPSAISTVARFQTSWEAPAPRITQARGRRSLVIGDSLSGTSARGLRNRLPLRCHQWAPSPIQKASSPWLYPGSRTEPGNRIHTGLRPTVRASARPRPARRQHIRRHAPRPAASAPPSCPVSCGGAQQGRLYSPRAARAALAPAMRPKVAPAIIPEPEG